MYARLSLVSLKSGRESDFKRVCDEFDRHVKSQEGFKTITYYVDAEVSMAGSFSLWESKEAADAAVATFAAQTLRNIASGLFHEPPRVWLLKVYEPSR